jgi:acetyl-CoA synthetase
MKQSIATPMERSDHVAIRWLGRDGTRRDFTYADVQEQSNRFANVLRGFDIVKRRLFPGRAHQSCISPPSYLEDTSVFCPSFSAFGPGPVYQRLSRGTPSCW